MDTDSATSTPAWPELNIGDLVIAHQGPDQEKAMIVVGHTTRAREPVLAFATPRGTFISTAAPGVTLEPGVPASHSQARELARTLRDCVLSDAGRQLLDRALALTDTEHADSPTRVTQVPTRPGCAR